MIDIYSKGSAPGCELSNFAEHHFVLDGVEIRSMEGFLQSLKYKSPHMQKSVCLKVGKDAKLSGKHKYRWKLTRSVYWKGKRIHLWSDELQELIDRAYSSLYNQCPSFRQALAATKTDKLCHSRGKHYANHTILTEYHFIRRLEMLRLNTPID